VERQNLRRRRPRAQLEQAEDHGIPVQVQQPNDNDSQPAYQPVPAQNPQPAYQPAPAQDHHNENAPPPHILPAPQVVQPVPQIENGEALIIPTKIDIVVFVSQKISNQIWNLEYIDLAHLLYTKIVSNIDKPRKVLGFDEDGDILIERSKYSKVKSITNIEEWSEGFLNYIKILLKRFPALANDLISYMSIIRSAIPDVPFKKMYKYDQQFRLRMARDHRRSWATNDGQLWLQFVATGGHIVTQNTPCMSYTVNRPCYDYNFKSYCTRINCIYNHTCIRLVNFTHRFIVNSHLIILLILVAIQLDHQTLHIDIHQICGWKACLYNQFIAILMPRELGKTLIFVLGQTLPDFLDSNSVYTKCKIKMFLK
jgi:hypothetical protein